MVLLEGERDLSTDFVVTFVLTSSFLIYFPRWIDGRRNLFLFALPQDHQPTNQIPTNCGK